MQKYVQEFLFVIVHSKGWYLKYLLVRRCNQIKSIVFPFFARWTLFKESLTVLFNWGLSPASDASERGPRRCCWRGHEGVPGGLIKWSDIQMFMLIFCSLPQLKTLSPTKPASHLARFLIWFYIWIFNGDGDSRIEQAGKSNYEISNRYHFIVVHTAVRDAIRNGDKPDILLSSLLNKRPPSWRFLLVSRYLWNNALWWFELLSFWVQQNLLL